MENWLIDLMTDWGLGSRLSLVAAQLLLILGIFLLVLVINFISKKILLSTLKRVAARTATKWDDILLETNLFQRLAHIVPVVVLYFIFPHVFSGSGGWEVFIQRSLLTVLIVIIVSVLNAFLTGVNGIYGTFEISKNRPIKGYLQIIRVFLTLMGLVWAIAVLLDKSAVGLISGIGAMSAVLMLVFKDSILGIVAAVQLSGNDMIRIGDWITVPDMGADGDVVDIKLQTVTVQNFDKTLVNVPLYNLISSSFKNWRGMSESGGRRIKRHLNIDMNSIKFCSPELLEKLNRIDVLDDYLERKQEEIDEDNSTRGANTSELINGRRMTNLGVFRAYISAYLKKHPLIDDKMTFLVRQLQPTDKGIPLEIYVFSRDQAWSNYEGIQADIFDHLLASVSFFELAVYQTPSSLDFRDSFSR